MRRAFAWSLEEGKFLDQEEVSRLRRSVLRRKERCSATRRLPTLEWFLVELALGTGLRVSEMSALKCGDLCMDEGFSGVLVRNGKGGKQRFVRCSEEFKETMRQYLAWKKDIGEPIDEEASLLLSSRAKTHMSTRALQKMFSRCVARAGIARRHSIHHCRHTHASLLYKASRYNLRLVQKQLGHSSIRTTEVYADVLNPDWEKALEKLYG